MDLTNPLFLPVFTVFGYREVPRIRVCRDVEVLKRLPLLSRSSRGQVCFKRLGLGEGVRLYRILLLFPRG